MKKDQLVCFLVVFSFWLGIIAPSGILSGLAQTNSKENEIEKKSERLQFSLRETVQSSPLRDVQSDLRAENLDSAQSNEILRRLPQMPVEPERNTDFRLSPNSLPPPKTRKTITTKFPAGEKLIAPEIVRRDDSWLEVEKFSPKGFMSVVSEISVTFSQPMVAVTSQSQASVNVPVEITPPVPGSWRWIGTKTLVFEPQRKFPSATDFNVKIPAGTRSANGGILTKEVSWAFSTSHPKVEIFLPLKQTVGRHAVVLAKFNQEINAAEVLTKIKATAKGKNIALRAASPEEIAADEDISERAQKLPPKQWLAFRAVEAFPLDSEIEVTFEKGLPSAEGKLTSILPQTFSFKTLGGLKFTDYYCGYDEKEKKCRAHDDLKIVFNNPLDENGFDKSQIKIEPPLEKPEISVSGSTLEIDGCCKNPRTLYKVTVPGSFKDEYGQALGKDLEIKFKIGPEEPDIFNPHDNFIVLDPNEKPIFSLLSRNYPGLKIRLYSVKPEDFPAFQAMISDEANKYPDFGSLVVDRTLKIKAQPDSAAETRIDLSPALIDGLGHAVLVVEPARMSLKNVEDRLEIWFEATQIGIDAFSDADHLTVYASELKNGKPLGDVQIELSKNGRGMTDQTGIAKIPLPEKAEANHGFLIARRGADSAILSEMAEDESLWVHRPQKDSLRWFVFNDREMYRPGETVSIKGYARRITSGVFSDVFEPGNSAQNLNYVLKDSRGNEILRGKAAFNSFGAFDFQIKIPQNINLGYERIELSADGEFEDRNFVHRFQVREFRRPEFEVSTRIISPAPFYVGTSVEVESEARYFAGGGLASADTNWSVYSEPASFTPPNRDEFTFGKFTAWWRSASDDAGETTTTQQFNGITNSDGKHRIAVDFAAVNPARPFLVRAESRTRDVNRQTFASSTEFLVHPSELYVGIRSTKNFVGSGDAFEIETITTDIDGNAVSGALVNIVAELKNWRKIKGEWQTVTVETQNCQLKSDTEPVSCRFSSKMSGFYTIRASVLDRLNRRNESETEVWTAGVNFESALDVQKENVHLIPDKNQYAPGETAEILVNAPFFPAEGVITLRRNGVLKTERFSMSASSAVVRIPVEENYLPNLYVQVDLFGATPRILYEDERDAGLAKRPAFAGGAFNLKISTASRRLTVTAAAEENTLSPGGSTTINVSVKDFQDNPVPDTEVAIVAVDESVLALTKYRIGNPVEEFYQEIESGVTDFHSRENIVLYEPEAEGVGFGYGEGNGSGSGSGDGDAAFSVVDKYLNIDYSMATTGTRLAESPEKNDQIRLRRNFNALAIFAPSVVTGADGRASLKLNLPDNLTRYRITAVAATKSRHFGTGESTITTRQPLIVRPSAPRFMNFGDRAELPVVIQNQTENAFTVDVAIRAKNAVLPNGNGKRVQVPANDRVEVRFDIAPEKTGFALFQIGAATKDFADAAEFAFPVLTPATTESFASYGTTEENGAILQPIQLPPNILADFGGLEVTTSSTQLQELTDAFIYLQSYPFECSEQISSRVVSVAALRDVLQAFAVKDLPTKEQIEAKMRSDIERLEKLQHRDGGYSFWRSDDQSLPFVTIHVAHALARARLKGYAVNDQTVSNLKSYLKNIESKLPDYYGAASKNAISAYTLYVRQLLGDKDSDKAKEILQQNGPDKLSPEALGWILSVLAGDAASGAQIDSILGHLLNRITETAGAAHFVNRYKDAELVMLGSDRRADGVILEALLRVEKSGSKNAEKLNELIPKIARGLLAGRTKGRWRNTQENAFILLALDQYFQTYERTTPDFAARVWLGETYAGARYFKGRTTEQNTISVPMDYLQKTQDGSSKLILEKEGEGRIYYRIGLNYAPQNLNLPAADYGFLVTRTYEAVDNPADVGQNPDGRWMIKSGARVRVRLEMIAPTRRYHVALVDKLPAGLEIVNPELANSETLPADKRESEQRSVYYYRASKWFEHQNLRDERAEVFASLVENGVWNYSYIARATTPGVFIAPPAKAEEMYAPETFGRSRTDFVTIE